MTTLDNFQLWQDLMALANTQQHGFIRPDINFTNWLNQVNNEMFQKYAEQYGRNQQLSDKLAPFVYSTNVIVTPAPGQPFDYIILPQNYEYLVNIKIIRQKEEPRCFCDPKLPIIDGTGECLPYENPTVAQIQQLYAGANLIERLVYDVDDQRWERALEHVFKHPTWDAPMVTQIAAADGTRMLKINPKGIQAVVLDYLRTPRQAVFNYTYVGNQINYIPSTSVNLEWSNILKNEFLYRMLKKYGNYVGQPEIVQIAEEYLKGL